MIDSRGPTIEVAVDGRDFTIQQSPGQLSSDHKQGTTGSVVWKITPLVAGWLSSKNNVLFQQNIVNCDSTVVELGSGISGIVPLVLEPRVNRVIATDQPHNLKLLAQNLQHNARSGNSSAGKAKISKGKTSHQDHRVDLVQLDWETDDAQSCLKVNAVDSVDMIIACDCIYNYALIEPLVETCASICRMRTSEQRPTLCVIAQQLRQPDVFEEWMTVFLKHYHVWNLTRLDFEILGSDKTDYVIHVGILRD